jgi:hypothetical protein
MKLKFICLLLEVIMAKKFLFVSLAIIVLCLCCGICFAAENNSVNLGNEVMQSIDKTGDSINNVKDAGNTIRNGANNVTSGIQNVGNTVKNTGNNVMNGGNAGNYNTVRTTTEGTATNSGLSSMTTTTWMWIILVVAAIVIIAAIWYYATQNND